MDHYEHNYGSFNGLNLLCFTILNSCQVPVWLFYSVSRSFQAVCTQRMHQFLAQQYLFFFFLDCFYMHDEVFLSQTCTHAYSGEVELVKVLHVGVSSLLIISVKFGIIL